MGFVQDVTAAMVKAEESGERAVRVDKLAALCGITGDGSLLAGEVFAKKVDLYRQMDEMGELTFPFELVTHRERRSAGVDFEGVVYKEAPLKDKDGSDKVNKNGEVAMQRYYWPALVRKNPAKETGRKAILDLAQTFAATGLLPENQFAVTADGLTLTIRYIIPNSGSDTAEVTDIKAAV